MFKKQRPSTRKTYAVLLQRTRETYAEMFRNHVVGFPPPLREEEEEEEEANLARTGSRRKTTAWCAPRLFRLPWGQPVPARQAETALHGVHRLPPRQGKEQVCGVQPREAEVPSREGQERLQGVREIRKGQAERTFRFIGKRARSGGQAQAHVNHANREYVLYFPNPADCFPTQD